MPNKLLKLWSYQKWSGHCKLSYYPASFLSNPPSLKQKAIFVEVLLKICRHLSESDKNLIDFWHLFSSCFDIPPHKICLAWFCYSGIFVIDWFKYQTRLTKITSNQNSNYDVYKCRLIFFILSHQFIKKSYLSLF